MKKLKKYMVCLLSVCCLFTLCNVKSIMAHSVSTGDFRPLDPYEVVIGHSNIGDWNNGSFFETATYQMVGRDPNTGYQTYRFRYYLTHKGRYDSYTYQVSPVGLFIDGTDMTHNIDVFNNVNYHVSNTTFFGGEKTIAVAPGVHDIWLADMWASSSHEITHVNMKWQIVIPAPTYNVSFVDHDGKLLKNDVVKVGESATPPPDPSWEGHTFVRWDKDYTNVKSDMVVTALYNINQYWVDFNPMGGTPEHFGLSIPYGSMVPRPTDPTRGTDKFMGWYTDPYNTSPSFLFNFFTKITQNTNLYAHWDSKPVIKADDMNIFRNAYTSDEWQKVRKENATASDKEDGDLTHN